jgi:nucleoside 2-deoxyribosyltransferase
MKTIYLAYKFKDSDPVLLKQKLEELSKIVEDTLKCKTFIFFRDAQKWGEIKMDIKKLVKEACKAVEKCDAILVEASEKASGTYFEVGYAKALGKKVIIVHQEGTEAAFLEAAADVAITYKNLEDLREMLGKTRLL